MFKRFAVSLGVALALTITFSTAPAFAGGAPQTEPGPCDPPIQNPVAPGTVHYTDPATGLCGELVPSVTTVPASTTAQPEPPPEAGGPAAPQAEHPRRLAHTGSPIGLEIWISIMLISFGLIIVSGAKDVPKDVLSLAQNLT